MIKRTLIAAFIVSQLQGCAAVVVGGAAVGAVTASEDNRTIGTQLDDTTFSSKISSAISKVPALDEHAHINVNVYNGIALLTGQAPTRNMIEQAEKTAREAAPIKSVHNQIRLGNPTAVTTRAHDLWLSSKVNANLLAEKGVDGFEISVIVEDSEVFLMGIVSSTTANRAIEIVRNISGVVKVVNAFEITN